MINKKLSIKEQSEIIESGTVEIIPKEELMAKLKKGKPLRIKWGADPSAPDIHLGHTVVLRKLRQFQDLGHQVIFLIGDFTAMIGDPSGRSETRPILSKEQVKKNAKTYKDQVLKILDPRKTRIVFNSHWLKKMSLEDNIRLSSVFTVARMLERDDFKKRFDQKIDISVLEFMYPLLQAYDSVFLKADIEVGGTDQKFNLLLGRTVQKRYNQEQQVVITMPLLEGTDGIQKMSKSLGNYIGITEPPQEIFGKVMSISDEIMLRYYDLVSGLSLEELEKVKADLQSGKLHPRDAKVRLAKILVSSFYSESAAKKAALEFSGIFSENRLPEEIPLKIISAGEIDQSGKIWIAKLMVRADLASSNSEARRLILQGGVKLDEKKIFDDVMKVDLTTERLLSVGKRRFARVRKG